MCSSVQTVGTVCLEAGHNGVIVEVGGGLYPNEISWSVTLPSGIKETGGDAGSWEIGKCPTPSVQPSLTLLPTPQPSITSIPTVPVPCEIYSIELHDSYGDG